MLIHKTGDKREYSPAKFYPRSLLTFLFSVAVGVIKSVEKVAAGAGKVTKAAVKAGKK